jgi:hypothetical protein
MKNLTIIAVLLIAFAVVPVQANYPQPELSVTVELTACPALHSCAPPTDAERVVQLEEQIAEREKEVEGFALSYVVFMFFLTVFFV